MRVENMVMLRKNANGAVVRGVNFECKLAPSYKLDFQMGLTLQSSKYDDAVDQGEDEDTANTTTDDILRTPEQYGYFAMNWKPLHEFTTTLSGSYTGPMNLIHLSGGDDKYGNEIHRKFSKIRSFYGFGNQFFLPF